jgi:hypothetical protein
MTTRLVLHLGYPTAKLGKHVELEKDPISTHAFDKDVEADDRGYHHPMTLIFDRSFRENMKLHSFTVSHQCKLTARSTDTRISLVMTFLDYFTTLTSAIFIANSFQLSAQNRMKLKTPSPT